ncbi:MAG TPA: C1 family peptidase, partial [Saprospiraceae bacterium]|nr:C1 family peptidase [Saprospiraceae bacterium]
MKIIRLPFCSARLLVFTLLFFLPWSRMVHGQGLLLDDQAHEAQPRMAVYDDGNKAELESLKGVYKVDLKPFCPAPQDQGLISSCTGWASGYGALTIMKAIEMGWEGKRDLITTNALSALFIYNQIKKGSCDFGAYMSDAAILVRDKGDALSKDYDKLKNKCDKLPSDQELKEALNYKVRDFVSLFSSGDAGNLKVLRTKMSLAQHKPVVIGISLLKNFQTIRSGTEYWYPQIGDTTANGGHALVVIGFDDGREAFEVMNSWGTAWANNGFVWIKYRDFARYSHYGYIFIGNKDDSGFYDLTAAMVIRKPAYSDSGELTFTELPVVFRNGAYELSGQALRKGDLLQPFLSQVKRDAYFYAFSVDARGSIHVHWPR